MSQAKELAKEIASPRLKFQYQLAIAMQIAR
jgi:hypothetical protein